MGTFSKETLRKLRIPLIVVAVLVILGAGYLIYRNSTDSALDGQRITVKAVQSRMAIRVTGSGNIQARKTHKIVPRIRQATTISWLTPEGVRVKEGDVIATLNTEQIERRIDDLEAMLKERVIELESDETEYSIQIIDNQTELTIASQAVTNAQKQLDQFIQGDMILNKRKAELSHETALSELRRAEKRQEDLGRLLKEGFVTEDEVEEARIAISTAKVELETARIQQQVLEKFTIPMDRGKVESAQESARTELEKTIKRNKSMLSFRAKEVEDAKRKVKEVQKDLEKHRAELENYTITAPVEGVVEYGDTSFGRRRSDIRVGQTLQRGVVIMTIPEITELQAAIDINEADIRKVKVGQKAQILMDAFSGRVIEGSVIKVAESAKAGGFFDSDINFFQVLVDLPPVEEMKPGFSCKAEIQTLTIENAIQVPIQAVYQEDGGFFVTPVEGGGVPKKVKIGEASTTHVQILEGLKAGQRVYISRPSAAEAGS